MAVSASQVAVAMAAVPETLLEEMAVAETVEVARELAARPSLRPLFRAGAIPLQHLLAWAGAA